MTVMSERRKYIRIPGNGIRVKIRSFEGPVDWNFHDIENISLGGLLLTYGQKLTEGDFVLITIDLADVGERNLVKCVARIIRASKIEDGYDVALQFEKISREDVNRLATYFEIEDV